MPCCRDADKGEASTGGVVIVQRVMIGEQLRIHVGGYLTKYLFAIVMLFIAMSLSQAQAGVEKLSNEEEIMEAFESGEQRIKVIVGMEMPQHLRSIKSYKSQQFQSQVRAEIADRQSNILSGLSADEFVLSHRYTNFDCFAGEVTPEGLEKLLAHRFVKSIELSKLEHMMLAQGISLINATAYRSTYNGQNLSIAISDTGVDYTHPRLGGGGFPNSKVIGGYDAGDDDSDPFPNGQAHGTACAGIAAGGLGTVGDYIGGVAYDAKIYAMKISFGSGGSAYDTDVIEAWDWCVSHQYDDPSNPIMIISHSFGGGRYYNASAAESARPSYAAAASRAVAAGITIFAASGNEGYCDSIASPAAFSDVISVGSVYDASLGSIGFCVERQSCASEHESQCSAPWACWDLGSSADEVSCYSNSAIFLDLLAPAHDAYTTDISGSGGYETGDYLTDFGGTSAACPYAAGAAACLQSAAKINTGSFLTPQEVRDVLVNTGDYILDGKVSITKPRINLGNAIDDIISGSSVTVPDIVGMTEANATTAITGAGLVVGTVSYACSDTVVAGDVVSQNPIGGTSVSAGSSVDFVVSSGQPSVPDVTGTTEAAATATINAVSGISVGTVTYACSDIVPAGDVVSQSVTGVTTCGNTVDLLVSTGQPLIPDVTGTDEASATATINAVTDISVGTVTYACSDTVPSGDVVSQSVTGTTTCGNTVDLLVSTGQPSVPDVTGTTEVAATATINAVNDISVGTVTYSCSDIVPAGDVVSQSVTGVTTCGNTVDLVVSSGQPSVPDVTGTTEAAATATINAVSGISVGTVTYACSDIVPAGDVVSQSVTGTTTCGNTVDLVVSTGQLSAPDVVGMSEPNAIDEIILGGLSVGTVIYDCNDTVPAGTVINQTPTAGSTCESMVDLLVSSGQPTVPDVVGMSEPNAINAVNAVANLSAGIVTYACSDIVASGDVISQSVTGTTTCGNTVDLIVSTGQPTVPDVVGISEPNAISAVNAVANLSVGTVIYACSDTVPGGDVISQSVTGVTTCGNTVDLVVSTGQPSVPDVTGIDEAAACVNINAVADISCGTVAYACSDIVAAGDVISQSVTGTTTCGNTVDLLVSTGRPSVPDVTGMAEATAVATIDAVSGISIRTVTYACSDTVSAGDVISQSVTGVTTCGNTVDLVVSTGQPTVPDVTGMLKLVATGSINAVSGLSIGTVSYACSNTVVINRVISQSITGVVPCGSTVDLVVSAGQPTVPDLRGETALDAIAILNGISDVSYGTTTGGCDESVAVGDIISQSETGTVACGTVINIIASVGESLVPDVTGMDEASAIAAIDPIAFLSVGEITYEYSTIPYGNVISQDPNAGFVPCDSTVDLVVSGGPPLLDNFDDNIRSAMWREHRNGLTDVSIIEDANQLNIISIGGASYQEAAYIANGWSLDVSTDFQIKVDFHFSGTDPNYAWVGITIENDDDYAMLAAGSDSGAAYYFADANSIIDQISRASDDGTLYVSYDSALNELYLSHTGYGSENAWQIISGMLQGAGPAAISVGGGSDKVILNSGRAYLDNFEVTAAAPLGWPPATDLDGDGFIGLGDLLVLSNFWLGIGPDGDITDDGSVDLKDFGELYLAW